MLLSSGQAVCHVLLSSVLLSSGQAICHVLLSNGQAGPVMCYFAVVKIFVMCFFAVVKLGLFVMCYLMGRKHKALSSSVHVLMQDHRNDILSNSVALICGYLGRCVCACMYVWVCACSCACVCVFIVTVSYSADSSVNM